MAALLETRALTKRFGGVLATDAVSLAVEPGEIRGLIGPNGAGKTTLVNLLTGIEAPDSGDIRLDGAEIAGAPPHLVARRGLVRTFQVCRLFGNLSLRENLLLPYLTQARRGDDTGRAKAERLLALTRLTTLADQPAKRLSGGQRALLQLACGFMVPGLRCYLLDEPFAGINPVIKEAIIELVLAENREHDTTFLVVSHEMSVIRRLCPRVTVLIAGRVLAEGSLAEVAAREDVIAAYLGTAFA